MMGLGHGAVAWAGAPWYGLGCSTGIGRSLRLPPRDRGSPGRTPTVSLASLWSAPWRSGCTSRHVTALRGTSASLASRPPISTAAPGDSSHSWHPVPQQGGQILTGFVFAPAAGGRLCGGKRASLPAARPFPVIQKVMASMAHLQEEKLRLQEELLGLQEKLAARENDELSRSLQLQGQVWWGQGVRRGLQLQAVAWPERRGLQIARAALGRSVGPLSRSILSARVRRDDLGAGCS